MAKLLLVDDDKELCHLLKGELERNGWLVEVAYTFADGMQLTEAFPFDLLILDWSLPDGTGLNICQTFRASGGTTPIIFLTGRNDIDSKESGLDSGADDYLTKPFNVRELLVRIRSLQRRPPNYLQQELSAQGVLLDLKLSRLTAEGVDISLSPTERALLEFLFRHPDQVFSGAELFSRVWPSDSDSSDGAIRVLIHSLRRKLEHSGLNNLIKTVRGSGYILESKQ